MLGLARNPFRDDGNPFIDVPQPADRRLAALVEGAIEGRPSPPIILHGERGIGLTYRLRRIALEAKQAGIYHATLALSGLKPEGLVPRLASSILAASHLGNLRGAMNAPRWYRELVPIAHRTSLRARGGDDGGPVSRALNANAPSVLMLDDLDSLPRSRSTEAFLQMLEDVRMRAPPEVLLVWTCRTPNVPRFEARFPLLHAGARRIEVRPMTDPEAATLVRDRLAAVRLFAEVADLFPFTPSVVASMNREAAGNPARLLRMASSVLESCSGHGPYEVDDSRLAAVLTMQAP